MRNALGFNQRLVCTEVIIGMVFSVIPSQGLRRPEKLVFRQMCAIFDFIWLWLRASDLSPYDTFSFRSGSFLEISSVPNGLVNQNPRIKGRFTFSVRDFSFFKRISAEGVRDFLRFLMSDLSPSLQMTVVGCECVVDHMWRKNRSVLFACWQGKVTLLDCGWK